MYWAFIMGRKAICLSLIFFLGLSGCAGVSRTSTSLQPDAAKDNKIVVPESSAMVAKPGTAGQETQGKVKSPEITFDEVLRPIPLSAGEGAEDSSTYQEGLQSESRLPVTGGKNSRGKEGSRNGSESVSGTDEQAIIINMENADLYEVVLFFIDQLGLNAIIESNITGKITIHSAGGLERDDLLPLFYQILAINGLTAVEEGGFYKIIQMADAPRSNVPLNIGSHGVSPGMQVQIIPLEFIEGEELVPILTPFISANGSLVAHADSNTLLLVDTKINIDKILKLVRSFDLDVFAPDNHRFFKIEYVASQDVVQTIKQILPFYGGEKSKVEVISLDKLNSLLVLADHESVFDKVGELLVQLDQPSNDVESHIYIYFLKNSQADEMSGLLKSIFTKKTKEEIKIKKTDGQKTGLEQNPFSLDNTTKTAKVTRQTIGADYGSGSLRGDIKITSDEIRNALIIDAIPSDYRVVEKVLKRLDILPRQVLISVTIVDVALDDGLDLGVEWTYQYQSGADYSASKRVVDAATGASGLLFSIGETLRWKADLSALAQKQRVDIVATPSVLASDNVAANIDISTEIPVASAQIQYDDTNSTNKTQTDIQYRNTGIILNVTPHINEFGLVSMDVNQEVSEQAASVEVGTASYPSFFKRSVKTTLTVNSDQTIIIGGLIREVKSDSSSGVPFLSEIPVVGWLFGTQEQETSKSELIIFITPKVIATPDDIDAVTEEFAQKVGYNLGSSVKESNRL